MTGGQDHPGTGRTLRGETTHKVDYETICRACGVEWVRKVDPYEVGKLYQTLREGIIHKGVSVVIASRPCVLDPVKIKGTPLAVNLAGCVACQACMNLGCPSITWADELYEDHHKVKIDPATCIGCTICAPDLSLRLHPAGAPMNTMTAAPHSDVSRATRNIMIVGVGGQGVIMVSKVMALLGQKQGLQVKQSEVHGMAKRGGIGVQPCAARAAGVVADDRQGRGRCPGRARMGGRPALARFPQAGHGRIHRRHAAHRAALRLPQPQGRRGLRLRQGNSGRGHRQGRRTALRSMPPSIAAELGDSRAANTVLLGTLSASLDYPVEDWLDVIDQAVPTKTREINRKAFEAGRAWAEAVRVDPSLRFEDAAAASLAPAAHRDISVRLEINAAWCKGCDICVKLCPERCLALNAEHVAVLKNPEACTGCHVCEWLCPDFAISVRTVERHPAVA